MRYVELNPVPAGRVEHPRDYRWSSYRAHADGAADGLLAEHGLYRRLGKTDDERQAAYRQLFRSQIAKADIVAIRRATNKAWALVVTGFSARSRRWQDGAQHGCRRADQKGKKVESDSINVAICPADLNSVQPAARVNTLWD